MEKIILISVLSTLGVVALVSSIVVAFMRLGKKVDVQKFETESNHLYECVRNLGDEVHNRINEEVNKINRDREEEWHHVDKRFNQVYASLEKLESNLDSRADKLYSLIKEIENTVQKKDELPF